MEKNLTGDSINLTVWWNDVFGFIAKPSDLPDTDFVFNRVKYFSQRYVFLKKKIFSMFSWEPDASNLKVLVKRLFG